MSQSPPPATGACSLCQRTLVRIGQGANRVNVCGHCDAVQCPNGHDVVDGTAKVCPVQGCGALVDAHVPREQT